MDQPPVKRLALVLLASDDVVSRFMALAGRLDYQSFVTT